MRILYAQVFLAFQSQHLSTPILESGAVVCNLSLLSYSFDSIIRL